MPHTLQEWLSWILALLVVLIPVSLLIYTIFSTVPNEDWFDN